MSFLSAEWRMLAIANYEADPGLLKKFLPAKTELDFWKNTCYLSLVGFMFKNTCIMGCKIPFHIDFEEVNLRFYVKYKEDSQWKRGVVFLKEFVPKPAITFVANMFYKEKYATTAMKHRWEVFEQQRQVEYQWKVQNQWQSILINAEKNPCSIREGSEAEFITEHYWGYSKVSEKKTFEYEVVHPRWMQYPVQNYFINVNFGLAYGKKFSFLNEQNPRSVMLADGSEIKVEPKKEISML